MSSADEDDPGPGQREVAHRLFAAEFDDATVSYAESDEERAPKYVVTPTGARVNRLFAVGVLTEVESVNEDVLRARVVDPTGAFVSYAGQYQPDAAAFFERADPPAFVALTGKARTFEPDDGDRIYSSVRPESVAEVDAETRDRWTVSAAEATLRRIAAMTAAKTLDAEGEALRSALQDRGYDAAQATGIQVALDRYGTTTAYLDALREVALDAVEVVAGDRDAVRSLDRAPGDAGTSSLGPLPAAVTDDGGSEAHAGTTTVESAIDDGTASTPDEDGGTEPSAAAETESEGEAASGTEATTEATTDPADADPASSTAEAAETGGVDDTDDLGEFDDSDDADGIGEFDDTDDLGEFDDSDDIGEFDDSDDLGEFDDTVDTDDPGEFDDSGDADDIGEIGDPDESDDLYELDEEERREVEESFDVGFESGTEVDDPGEAGIDVPGPEDLDADAAETEAADAATASADETDDTGSADETDDTGSADETDDTASPDEDVDLEAVAVEAMGELDDGDGAARDAVVAAVVDEYGADPGAVADAIEDALMSGKCYEPSEDSLKAI
ncbi:hypothetical protein ACOZ4L_12665 [Haloplanus ruber]|uniref:hypothetical protein n=1 Tax=Haloplanus ruber TaxID=869892 RepID=UPI0021131E4E|nr:hypothetical protein [Haloplanus ruber]